MSTEKLGNVLKITQLVSGRTRILTQAVWSQVFLFKIEDDEGV